MSDDSLRPTSDLSRDAQPLPSQAQRIIDKFGSPYYMSQAIQRATGRTISPSTIYRWTYAKSNGKDGRNQGTGGVIPNRALQELVLPTARLEGILLTPDDLNPATRMKK